MKSGLLIAPIIAVLLYFLPLPLTPEGQRMLAIAGLAMTLWVTEALPLPATALLLAVLIILFGVGKASEVFTVFADPLLFLFIGSFILAEAMQVHGLDRRFAHGILRSSWVRAKSGRMIFIYSCIAFFISMWVSNTATTAMLFPIGLSMIRTFPTADQPKIGPLILLMTSFGASIGGMATPVGTPPNLIGIGFIKELTQESITFGHWMQFALPVSLVTFLAIYFAMRFFHARDVSNQEMKEIPEDSQETYNPRAQRNVAIAFGVTVFLWLLPTFAIVSGGDTKWWEERLPESVAAIVGTVLLFLLPVDWKEKKFTISWKQAQNINWGIILLFGGGLVLGKFLFKTGVAKWIGDSVSSAYPFQNEFMFILLFTVMAVLISEFTSNTASANLILPISIAVSQASGLPAVKIAIAATLASSLGFMLPISTAPNAIVFGSAMIPIRTMMKYGIVLDLLGALIVAVGVYWLV